MTFRRCPIDLLVGNLQRPDDTGRPVVDKTGLTGKHDFTLFYHTSNFPQGTGEDAPDIEQAVQQQLTCGWCCVQSLNRGARDRPRREDGYGEVMLRVSDLHLIREAGA